MVAKTKQRVAFIQALRDCADFFEQRPEVKTPLYSVLNVFVDTKEDLATHARAATWEKNYVSNWFMLRKVFGTADVGVTLEINAQRETVCRKVVTGTTVLPARPEQIAETYEWVCENEPLLSESARLTEKFNQPADAIDVEHV